MELAMVILHLDCPANAKGELPPKFAFEGGDFDAHVLHFRCPTCRVAYHVTFAEQPVEALAAD